MSLNILPDAVRPVIVPLDLVPAGEWVEVAEVTGDAGFVCRLSELGIRQGCRLQMVQPGSTCLLKIANCRLCLRPAECGSILVHPVGAGEHHDASL